MALLGALAFCLSACGVHPSGESVEPSSILGQADTPDFSVASGMYSSSQSVEIVSDTPGAVIYYTTDGSDPTTFSRVYGGPVSVTTDLTLKALAVARGYGHSKVAEATYAFDTDYQSVSGLPIPPQPDAGRFVEAPGGVRVLNWAGFKAAISYTFDDSAQADEYPQLRATGQRMTFFLAWLWVKAQDISVWSQAARDGQEIGNHTLDHCAADGSSCPDKHWAGSAEAEYDQCTEYLKKVIGVENVWTTAAPYGDTDYDGVARTRFFLNRGVNGGHVRADGRSDPFQLPVQRARHEGADKLNGTVDAAIDGGYWRILMFHSLKGSGYDHVEVKEVVRNINYAKSKRDIWIDSMVNVGAYWVGQEAIEDAREAKSEDGLILKWTLPNHFPSGKYVRVTLNRGMLKQEGRIIPWNDAGYYEVALDPGSLTIVR